LEEFNLTIPEVLKLFVDIIKDDPYLFFVDDTAEYTYVSSGRVVSLKPRYIMSKTEAECARDYCLMRVHELSHTNAENDFEIALELHDRICEGFDYDDSLECDNVYDFLITGVGTCQAYAQLYLALLREYGIECHYVASDSMAHMWVIMQLDGEWYHVDVTWDDGESTSRRHFLCSDDMACERGHRDWYSCVDVECKSEKYHNYFEKAEFDSEKSLLPLFCGPRSCGVANIFAERRLFGEISTENDIVEGDFE
jgi:hypothetical protein